MEDVEYDSLIGMRNDETGVHARRLIGRTFGEARKEYEFTTLRKRPRRILFDHLPKCGGSSLNTFLAANYPRRKIFSIKSPYERSIEEFKRLPEARRHSYYLVKGHFADSLIDYAHPDCLKVTMLREPIDRIVSHYFYVKSAWTHPLYEAVHDSNMSLVEYVTSGLSSELRNWMTCHFSGMSISEAEKDPNAAIERAFHVLTVDYDLVGVVENFASFTKKLSDLAELHVRYTGEKTNVTVGRPSLESLQPSEAAQIESLNSLDVELFRRIKESSTCSDWPPTSASSALRRRGGRPGGVWRRG